MTSLYTTGALDVKMRMWSSILLWRVLGSPILHGLQSGRFTLNQLWNEGAGEFFRQWQSLMQGVEHIDGALSHVERVKAHRGEGWPDKFADGEIIGANEGHLLWHLYTEASKRAEQDHRVLIAKGIDARGTISTHQGGPDKRKSSRRREVQWQDIQAHPRFLSDSRMHPLQPLQVRFFWYR